MSYRNIWNNPVQEVYKRKIREETYPHVRNYTFVPFTSTFGHKTLIKQEVSLEKDEIVLKQEDKTAFTEHLKDIKIPKGSCNNAPKLDFDNDKLCQCCMQENKNMVCIPCFHVFYCESCCKKVPIDNQNCPVCRTKVDDFKKIYL